MTMSSYEGLKRLAEEQQRALAQTDEELTKWGRFKDDYEKLQKKLRDLPDCINYEYMVPFGPLAFMPGQLIHTNEILVLLGDNWFAEMSAKQSCEVIDRRLSEISKSIEQLNEQRRLLQTRSDFTHNEFTAEKSQEHDITEEYDSDTERQWRKAHRESVRREKITQRGGKSHTDEDVLVRLEALRLQEMKGREMSRLEDQSVPKETSSKDTHPQKKSVHWSGETEVDTRLQLPESSTSSCDDSGSTGDNADFDSDDSIEGAHSPVIYFKHSPRSDSEDINQMGAGGDAGIISPADIYKLYCKPKSILKHSNTDMYTISAQEQEKADDMKREFKFHSEQTAIQSHVVEKTAPSPTTTVTAPSITQTAPQPDNSKPTQRVSKFKAMRQKKSS